jgi:hypothetical protein
MTDPDAIINYELVTTQYGHPEQKTGMHTNGPRNIFIRRGSGNWYFVKDTRSVHIVRRLIEHIGFDEFVADFCAEVQPYREDWFNPCWRRFNGP